MHPCLLDGALALLVVARAAGRHKVVPGVLPALRTWGDVVKGEVAGAETAVLAGVVVSEEHFAASERYTAVWSTHHVLEADNRWAPHRSGRRVEPLVAHLEHLGLARHDE